MIEQRDNIIKDKHLDRIAKIDKDYKQITIGDTRYYKKSDIFYPSVTYILSYYPKGKQFENWLKENGEESNTIAARSAERGSNVHKAIEEMLLGKEPVWITDAGYANYALDEWLMILRFADFWNTYKPRLIASEYHVFSHEHKYAGTIDLVLEINGEIWVVDIKTSNNLHTTYELQTAAYQYAWNEHNEEKVTRTGILWLKAKTRKTSGDILKIQGRGWSLNTSDRKSEENMALFLKVYDIFKIENPDLRPVSEMYPNSIKLQLD